PYCNATWDEIYCWPATLAGDTVRRSCSEVMKDDVDFDPLVTQKLVGDAYRICSEDGTWLWGNWTNYNVCLEGIVDINRVSGFRCGDQSFPLINMKSIDSVYLTNC
ncbi:unnamed protein product, partial [Allacma fusca]